MSDKATKKATGGGLHQLTEIDTEEVSLVDAGANGRKLLIVKSKGQENQMATRGAAVQQDVQGNNTAVNKDAAAGGQAAKVMKLSATNKESLTKQLGEFIAVLTKAKADVDGAEVVTTGGEVPAEFAEQLGPTAVAMAKMAPTAVEKAGFKQFTPERLSALASVRDNISALLEGVAPPPKPDPTAAAASQQAATVDVDEVVEKVAKKLGDNLGRGFESVATGIENITKAVNIQAGKLTELQKARGGSNAGNSEGLPPRHKVKKSKEAWPKDLGLAHREKQAEGARKK